MISETEVIRRETKRKCEELTGHGRDLRGDEGLRYGIDEQRCAGTGSETEMRSAEFM